jgi:hypothetical protein
MEPIFNKHANIPLLAKIILPIIPAKSLTQANMLPRNQGESYPYSYNYLNIDSLFTECLEVEGLTKT